jgi:hypothetical protein
MKRYELDAFDTITEKPDGYLVYYDDVLKETIPRPDPDEVRKAVINYRDAIQRECLFDAVLTGEEELTLLKLMGVKNE